MWKRSKAMTPALLVLLLGALWGLNEVVAGGILDRNPSPWLRLWLAAWAVIVLALGRGILNRPGSSLAVGSLAVLFKTMNTAPYPCHLLGIFLLAAAFDAAATVLLRREERLLVRTAAAGAAGVYAGYLLFAAAVTWIFRMEPWASKGGVRVAAFVLGSGSAAALAAALAAPLSFAAGVRLRRILKSAPRPAFAAAALGAILLWTAGSLVLHLV